MRVEVLGITIRHNGSPYKKGESFLIAEDQLPRIAKFVNVIDADEHEGEPKEIDDMTLAELKEYAKRNDIDLDGATKKEDVLAKVKGEDGGQNEANND